MMKFCFPERDPETIDENERNDEQTEVETKSKKKGSKKNRDSNFYVNIERIAPIDDVEKMKVSVLSFKTQLRLIFVVGTC